MSLIRSTSLLLKVVLGLYLAIIAIGVVFLVEGGWGGWVFIGIGIVGVAWRLSIEHFKQRLIREDGAAKAVQARD